MIFDVEFGAERQGVVQLQTGTVRGDVLQKAGALVRLAAVIRPLHSDHVRAHQPRFCTPVYHMSLESTGWKQNFSGGWRGAGSQAAG